MEQLIASQNTSLKPFPSVEATKPLTVSQMVKHDYRLADVFKKWGINYCCGGNSTLDEICAIKGLNMESILEDMKEATQLLSRFNTLQSSTWSFEFLVDYISNVHHAYIKEQGIDLKQTIMQFVVSHKKRYPYLEFVELSYNQLLSRALLQIRKEEEVIFPYLKQISAAHKQKAAYGPLLVRTLKKTPTDPGGTEQAELDQLVTALREVTDHYQFDDQACTNHQVIYHKLKEFDADLVQHRHLENNILFPRAMQMEKELLLL